MITKLPPELLRMVCDAGDEGMRPNYFANLAARVCHKWEDVMDMFRWSTFHCHGIGRQDGLNELLRKLDAEPLRAAEVRKWPDTASNEVPNHTNRSDISSLSVTPEQMVTTPPTAQRSSMLCC